MSKKQKWISIEVKNKVNVGEIKILPLKDAGKLQAIFTVSFFDGAISIPGFKLIDGRGLSFIATPSKEYSKGEYCPTAFFDKGVYDFLTSEKLIEAIKEEL